MSCPGFRTGRAGTKNGTGSILAIWEITKVSYPPNTGPVPFSFPRELTKLNRGVSLEQMVAQLRRYLIGWRGYFGFCQTPWVLRSLDSWIRRRLRCFQWKQWKRGKTRFAELRKRGVGKDLAAQTAGSSRGPWHLSRSPALSIALPNAYFASLGLPKLDEPKPV